MPPDLFRLIVVIFFLLNGLQKSVGFDNRRQSDAEVFIYNDCLSVCDEDAVDPEVEGFG